MEIVVEGDTELLVASAGSGLRVTWSYAEDPYRVGTMDQEIRWPGLPKRRRAAARRVADQCTVHHTLEHPPEARTSVSG